MLQGVRTVRTVVVFEHQTARLNQALQYSIDSAIGSIPHNESRNKWVGGDRNQIVSSGNTSLCFEIHVHPYPAGS